MPKARLKKVKLGELRLGLKVVLDDRPDSLIYTVAEVSDDGFEAGLRYEAGGTSTEGGLAMYSQLYYPSDEQLARNGNQLN